MRGLVIFAILFALGAVIDAIYFNGRHLDDAQKAITSLAALKNQIGR
jgi:hypothetical protein